MGRFGSVGTELGSHVYTPLDLFRYTSSGVRDLTVGPTSPYFSINTGATNLGTYNNPATAGDASDWVRTLAGDFMDRAIRAAPASSLPPISSKIWCWATSSRPRDWRRRTPLASRRRPAASKVIRLRRLALRAEEAGSRKVRRAARRRPFHMRTADFVQAMKTGRTFALRKAAKPSPPKPSISIAQVESAGMPEARRRRRRNRKPQRTPKPQTASWT